MKNFLIQTLIASVTLLVLIMAYHLILVPYVVPFGPGVMWIVILGLGIVGGLLAEQVSRLIIKEKPE